MLPPERVPMRVWGPPSMPKAFMRRSANRWILPAVQETGAHEATAIGDDHVLHHGGLRDWSRGAAGRAGHVGKPALAERGGRDVRDLLPVVEDPAPEILRSRATTSSSSPRPLPLTPATPTISQARTVRLTWSRSGRPRPGCRSVTLCSSSTGPPQGVRLLSIWYSTLRPTMSWESSALSTSAVVRTATTAPLRITVTRWEISFTSCSLCVMMMIVFPSAWRLRSVSKSVLDLLLGEHRGRLVEDEQPRVAVEDPHDRHLLPLPDGEGHHLRARVDAESVALDHGPDALDGRCRVDEQMRPQRLDAENDVLRDAELGDQLEVLVHHADAQPIGVQGAADGHTAAVEGDGAGVRLLQAGKDLHQGGLPGAVLADDGMDLVLLHGEVDGIVGEQVVRVELGNALHLEIWHHIVPGQGRGSRGERCPRRKAARLLYSRGAGSFSAPVLSFFTKLRHLRADVCRDGLDVQRILVREIDIAALSHPRCRPFPRGASPASPSAPPRTRRAPAPRSRTRRSFPAQGVYSLLSKYST